MQKTQLSSIIPFQAITDRSRSCRLTLFNSTTRRMPAGCAFTSSSPICRTRERTVCGYRHGTRDGIRNRRPRFSDRALSAADRQSAGATGFCQRANSPLAELVQTDHASLQGFIYLCRNPLDTLLRELPARAIVVIGARARWPFSKSKRLARALRKWARSDSGNSRLRRISCSTENRTAGTKVVVASTVMLSFISFWHAASIVLNDLARRCITPEVSPKKPLARARRGSFSE
jgi:hypothetical protein